MALENANFIPELVETNPDGTDLASTLDDHHRTTKRAVKGSFPAFVGTTGTPKSVNKSEDQINDCAEKSADEDILGAWTIQTQPIAVTRVKEREITTSDTVLQADEQAVIRYTGVGGHALTFDALLADTVGTVKNVGSGSITLTPGTATITWLDGTGSSPTGARTLGPGSVIEYHYTATGAVEIWGNGLS